MPLVTLLLILKPTSLQDSLRMYLASSRMALLLALHWRNWVGQKPQIEFRDCPKWHWPRRSESQLRSQYARMSLAGDNLSGPAMR